MVSLLKEFCFIHIFHVLWMLWSWVFEAPSQMLQPGCCHLFLDDRFALLVKRYVMSIFDSLSSAVFNLSQNRSRRALFFVAYWKHEKYSCQYIGLVEILSRFEMGIIQCSVNLVKWNWKSSAWTAYKIFLSYVHQS